MSWPNAAWVFRKAVPEHLSCWKREGLINSELSESLRGMAGFRNVAVHQYDELDIDILRWVVESGHHDFIKLGQKLGVAIRP